MRKPRFNKHNPPYQGIDTMPATKLFTYSNKALNMNTDIGLLTNPGNIDLHEFTPFLTRLKRHLEYFGERTAPLVAIINSGYSLNEVDLAYWQKIHNFNNPVMGQGGFAPFLQQQMKEYSVLTTSPTRKNGTDVPHLYAITYYVQSAQDKLVRANYENYHIIREFYSVGAGDGAVIERLTSVSRGIIMDTYTQLPLLYGSTSAIKQGELDKILAGYTSAPQADEEVQF